MRFYSLDKAIDKSKSVATIWEKDNHQWDSYTEGSDRAFADCINNVFPTEAYFDESHQDNPVWYYRPSNFDAWKIIIENKLMIPMMSS